MHAVVAPDEANIIRDRLIQRFEFIYELAWKYMFYWLHDQGEQVLEMQKPDIQTAFRCEFIAAPGRWEEIKKKRDETRPGARSWIRATLSERRIALDRESQGTQRLLRRRATEPTNSRPANTMA